MRGRNLTLAAAVSVCIGGALALWGIALDRLSIDYLHLIYERLWGPAPFSDQVVVVAVDEATYRDDQFSNLPQALWTPQLGQVLSAVLDGKPKAVGVDIVFSTTADSIIRRYDKLWTDALKRAAAENQIVLAYTQNQAEMILPAQQQRTAVGGLDWQTFKNLAPANLELDPDGVARRYAMSLPLVNGSVHRTLGAELAVRAGTDELPRGDIALNFAAAPRPLLYSLADLLACAAAGRSDFFGQHFAGKIVLIGGILDIEDRKLTSGRFATQPEGRDLGEHCEKPVDQALYSGNARDSMPGVLVHAAAIHNLLHGSDLRSLSEPARAALLILLSFVTALAFVSLRPRRAIPAWVGLLAAWSGAAILMFTQFWALPWLTGLAAIALAGPAGIVLRLAVIDRARRRLRSAFSLYLPKSEVDRLIREERPPALGGELREVTILFSDIASYSTLSERVAPGPLVDDLNRYFGRMTDIVQAHGGFVDKFIGDGILAIFGAPLARSNAALDAVRASLAMIASLQKEPLHIGAADESGGGRISIRIGLHSGEAIVGNIGSPQRFNYTVMGDAVNVASRLEGVGKHYGIPIVVSEQVRDRVGEAGAFRELDFIRVIGRDRPVRLYQPLTEAEARQLDLPAFAAALQLWRRGEFEASAKAFAMLAESGDDLAARYVGWARTYAATPMSDWEGVIQQGSK